MHNYLVTQRLEYNRHGDKVDVLEHNYLTFFRSIGINLIAVPNIEFDASSLEFDGVIFSGGGDLPNEYLSQNIHDQREDLIATERYRLQSSLLEFCIQNDKKVLGICYGMQMVMSFFGAMIKVAVHKEQKDRKPGLNHSVDFKVNDGQYEEQKVNGYHNQGLCKEDLPALFSILALDKTYDVVELCKHKTLPILCMQWHPERKSPNDNTNRELIKTHLGI